MKIKSILIGFISILFVFLAKAEEDATIVSPVDQTCISTTSSDNNHSFVHNDAFFKCKIPQSKARKIRPRFRNVSFFEIQLNDVEKTGCSIHAALAPITPRTNGQVQPFYYTFLFRLTPF